MSIVLPKAMLGFPKASFKKPLNRAAISISCPSGEIATVIIPETNRSLVHDLCYLVVCLGRSAVSLVDPLGVVVVVAILGFCKSRSVRPRVRRNIRVSNYILDRIDRWEIRTTGDVREVDLQFIDVEGVVTQIWRVFSSPV